MAVIDSSKIILSFRAAMQEHGISCQTEIISDDELHRFKPESRRNPDAWYCLHLDGIPAGSFGDWRTGESFTWCSKSQSEMTPDERADFKRQIEEQKQARAAKEQKIHEKARQTALKIWESAKPATAEHPYLKRKQVQPYGVRVDRQGRLIIPARDAAGVLHTVQRIWPDRREPEKPFLSGGVKKGHFFEIPGDTKTVYIAEGYATGASIHEATGALVIIAFDAGNLGPVTKIVKEKYAN